MKILEEYGIEQDPRLARATKEMLITMFFTITYMAFTLGIAWILGMSKPPQNYSYIFGFPAWYFCVIFVSPAVFFCVMVFLVCHVIKDDSLEPWLFNANDGGENNEN